MEVARKGNHAPQFVLCHIMDPLLEWYSRIVSSNLLRRKVDTRPGLGPKGFDQRIVLWLMLL